MDKVTFSHRCFSALVSEEEKDIAPHMQNGLHGSAVQPATHLCSFPLFSSTPCRVAESVGSGPVSVYFGDV